jgi:peptidoglycan/LPS O-acetylase OafA/YrhL
LAACLVMLYHYGSGNIGGPLARNGYLAVDLFFILSGFVMAMSYGHTFERGTFFASFGQFIGKRIARVYPLYLLMTVIMGGCVYAGLDPLAPAFPPHIVAANALMIQSWGVGMSIDQPAWSISTEWAAYILFPALLPIALRVKPSIQIVTAGFCLGVILVMTWLPTEAVRAADFGGVARHGLLNIWDGATFWPVARCVAEFTLGMLAWRARQSAWLSRVVTAPVATAIAVAALALWCVPGADVVTVAAFAMLVPVLAFQRGMAARVLGMRAPFVLGEWSYAIYLVHPVVGLLIIPVAALLTRHHVGHGWSIAGLAAVPVTLIVSGALHYSFEKPARRWVRNALTPQSLAPAA